jgi:hypothetical protein
MHINGPYYNTFSRYIPDNNQQDMDAFVKKEQEHNNERFGTPDHWFRKVDENIDYRGKPIASVAGAMRDFGHPNFIHEVLDAYYYIIMDDDKFKTVRIFCLWQIKEYVFNHFEAWQDLMYTGANSKYYGDDCPYGRSAIVPWLPFRDTNLYHFGYNPDEDMVVYYTLATRKPTIIAVWWPREFKAKWNEQPEFIRQCLPYDRLQRWDQVNYWVNDQDLGRVVGNPAESATQLGAGGSTVDATRSPRGSSQNRRRNNSRNNQRGNSRQNHRSQFINRPQPGYPHRQLQPLPKNII